MSSYLTIKKDGVTIGCWSRSEKMYDVFDNANFGEFKEFDPENCFSDGIQSIKEDINNSKRRLTVYEKMLIGITDIEDRFEICSAMSELENLIKEWEELIIQIQFMLRMYNDSIYDSDVDQERNIWTWMVD